jgi:uncharacterized membrane protein
MAILILGLVLFALAHGISQYRPLKARLVGAITEGGMAGVVSLVAFAGVFAMVWGYGEARFQGSELLWDPPVWTRHLATLLMLPSLIMVIGAYTPNGVLKPALKHPMLAGVKLWAVSHLLANGSVADVVLFGGMLAWAVFARIVIARRERAAGTPRPARGPVVNDLIPIVAGSAVWALFVFWAHEALFAVSPLGM